MIDRSRPDSSNDYQAKHAALILSSHRRLLGTDLLTPPSAKAGVALYESSCVVLAHEASADPVFFYANRAAQTLFEMSWDALVRLPSRYSAEPLVREERQRLLERVAAQGYIDDYSGIRIAASGRRFRIERATVWNLIDSAGQVIGQAAAFSEWEPLPE